MLWNLKKLWNHCSLYHFHKYFWFNFFSLCTQLSSKQIQFSKSVITEFIATGYSNITPAVHTHRDNDWLLKQLSIFALGERFIGIVPPNLATTKDSNANYFSGNKLVGKLQYLSTFEWIQFVVEFLLWNGYRKRVLQNLGRIIQVSKVLKATKHFFPFV